MLHLSFLDFRAHMGQFGPGLDPYEGETDQICLHVCLARTCQNEKQKRCVYTLLRPRRTPFPQQKDIRFVNLTGHRCMLANSILSALCNPCGPFNEMATEVCIAWHDSAWKKLLESVSHHCDSKSEKKRLDKSVTHRLLLKAG